MKKLISLMGLSLINGMAFAECTSTHCAGYVEKLYVQTSGTVYVGTDGNESLLNCAPHAGVYSTLDMSQPGADAIYSTLLAAQMANKIVTVRINEGSTGCLIQYITSMKQ
ncbi:hypothetical protein ACJJH9_00200 (plasmid) [Microbulbifer sp. DLAB2-AF]|uniref:hypothetical protein n=1 Tax=Microbulbifer sp. DLAB2-AF TaxID=3243395 RepID=UPI00403A6138